MKKTLLSILIGLGWASAAAQIPVPQIPLSGNIGCQGFPCVNNGILNLTTDANHTMTGQETSAFYIKVTSGVSLTATRNLIYPAGRFPVTVENATTGGQSIQVIGLSGTGVTIPNGQTVSVWNDGTDFVQVGGDGGGVSSFNTRTGAVTLSSSDVNAAGDITNNTSGTAASLGATPSQCSGGTPVASGIQANGDANCTTSGGSATFDAITSGTNTAATMVVGSGASLNPSGTGVVNANQVNGLFNQLQLTALINYGDSTVSGVGASTPRKIFGAQLINDVPAYWTNNGESGIFTEQVATVNWFSFNPNTTDVTLTTCQGGINDANSGVLDNAGGLANAALSMQSCAAHSALALATQQMASTATATGSWSDASGTFPATGVTGTSMMSTTNGNTLTFTLPAAPYIALWWPVSDASAGTFTATLNGTLLTNQCTTSTTFNNFGCNSQSIIINGGLSVFEQSFPANASGSNTLVITVTSATSGSNIVYIMAASPIPATANPHLLVSLQGVQAQYLDAKSTATADFNTALHTAYTNLFSNGLSNLFFVDLRNGASAGSGYPAARAVNTTTDYVSTTCAGGEEPLHFNDCGYQAVKNIYESSAAAAGFPLAIHNVNAGATGTTPGPIVVVGPANPEVSDFSLDNRIGGGTTGLCCAPTYRNPGIILNSAGSAATNYNTNVNGRTSVEYAGDAINGGAFKLENENAQIPIALCSIINAANSSLDLCDFGFYPGNDTFDLSGGIYYKYGTFHFGAIGNWDTTNPTIGNSLSVAYDSMQTITGSSSVPTSMVVYLESGATSTQLPGCNPTIVDQIKGNWIQFYENDSGAPLASFTWTVSTFGSSLDTVNGGSTYVATNIPPHAKFEVQCSQSTATSSNISIQELLPKTVSPLYGTTTTITGTALTATCDSGSVTVAGAIVGSPVTISATTGVDVGGAFDLRASVTATNTVTAYICGTGTPPSLAYNVTVIQ